MLPGQSQCEQIVLFIAQVAAYLRATGNSRAAAIGWHDLRELAGGI